MCESICLQLLLFFIHAVFEYADKANSGRHNWEYLCLEGGKQSCQVVLVFRGRDLERIHKNQRLTPSTSDFLLHFQGDLSQRRSKLPSQDNMFPFRRSQLLLSCILLVALVQLPRSESRPATERTDTGETLHRCRPINPAGENIKMWFLVTATALFFKKRKDL